MTRTKPGLAIFDRPGKLLEIWEEDSAPAKGISQDTFTKSAHGLYWSKEHGKEFLYFTENKPGSRVTKTDLKGNVLLRIGNVAEELLTPIKFAFDNPTGVAISANGDIYAVDGYGRQLVHRFSKDGKLIRTIGGKGKENGKFNVCHGIWINTLRKTPEVYIADRVNSRLEVYSLDLDYKRSLGEVPIHVVFTSTKNFFLFPTSPAASRSLTPTTNWPRTSAMAKVFPIKIKIRRCLSHRTRSPSIRVVICTSWNGFPTVACENSNTRRSEPDRLRQIPN